MSVGVQIFDAAGQMVWASVSTYAFFFEGKTYGFEAHPEDHDRAIEMTEGEITEREFVELNLMFDLHVMFEGRGVSRVRMGLW